MPIWQCLRKWEKTPGSVPFKSLNLVDCWVSILQMAPWTRSSPKVNRSRPVVYKLLTFDQAILKGKPESEGTPVFVSVQSSLCNTSYRITLYMFILVLGYRFYFCIWKSMYKKGYSCTFWEPFVYTSPRPILQTKCPGNWVSSFCLADKPANKRTWVKTWKCLNSSCRKKDNTILQFCLIE